MTVDDVQHARQRILEVLASSETGIPMRTVIDNLRQEPNVREDALRIAVWELIDRGVIKLTPNRELQAA